MAEGLYLFAACWALAMLEIEIEGPHGWAEKLPTWRYSPEWLLALTNGKPLTGYWLYLNSFLVLMFHLPLLFVPFSAMVEGRILGFYFLTCVVWDFQWFVWNPAWGVRRFVTEGPWWFRKRLLGFPVDYYTGIFVSWLAVRLMWPEGQAQWTATAGTVAAATAASIGAAALRRAR